MSRRRRTLSLALPGLVALLVCGAERAGTQTAAGAGVPPVFRVDSELVVIDLLVEDRDGRFVADLRPEELRVTEEGDARPVEFLRLVRRDDLAASLEAPTGTPAGYEAARPEPGSGLLAIVIDLQGTPTEAMHRVREAVRAMVGREIPDGTPLMLATVWHGLAVRQPLTTDRTAFLRALDAIQSPAGAGSALQQMAQDLDRMMAFDRTSMSQQALAMGRAVIVETSHELAEVSQTLAAFARSLAALPGRKHVVLYSGGYALRPAQGVVALLQSRFPSTMMSAGELSGSGRDGIDEIRRLIDDANRCQVSFYAVDPMGLQGDAADITQSGPVWRDATLPGGQGVRRRSIRESQDYLRTLAGDTGGRAFVNTNDLARGLQSAWADAREYYLVGFVPQAKGEGFRRVGVKLSRRGVDVRYRRGYWREGATQRADRDLVLAAQMPELFADGELRAATRLTEGTLEVTSLLRQDALVFVERDGRKHCTVSIQALLRGKDGKLVGGRGLLAVDVDLHMSPAEFDTLRASGNVEIPARAKAPPPGTYRLVVIARHSGTRLSAHMQEVVVP